MFTAPAKIEGLGAEAERTLVAKFRELQNELDAVTARPRTTPVQRKTYSAREGEVVRCAPLGGTMRVQLPQARPENASARVVLVIETPGTVQVSTVKGTVDLQRAGSFAGPGVVELISNGDGGWFSQSASGNAQVSNGAQLAIAANGGTVSQGTVRFQDANGLSWSLNGSAMVGSYNPFALSAGTQSASGRAVVLSDSNGISFGMNTNAVVTAAFDALKSLSLIAPAASLSQSLSNLTDSTLSGPTVFLQRNTSTDHSLANVYWRIQGNTMLGLAQQRYIAGASNLEAPSLSLVDTNGASWAVSTANFAAVGRVARLSLDYAALRAASAGTQLLSNSTLRFVDANGITWGLNGQSLTASYSVPAVVNSGLLNVTNSVSSVNASRALLSAANGFSFLLSTGASGATLSGSYTVPAVVNSGLLNVSAAGSSVNASALVFTNTNNVGFALSTGASGATLRAAASISFQAGTSTLFGSNISFGNANGVTFGMNGSTLTASVAAAAGGGVALSADGGLASTGTVSFPALNSLSTRWTLPDGNIEFGLTGGTKMTGIGYWVWANATSGVGLSVTRLNFLDSNGIAWGASNVTDASGRAVNITASLNRDISFYRNWQPAPGGGVGAANTIQFTNLTDTLWVSPFGGGWPFPGDMTASTADFLVQAALATNSTASFGFTLRGGVYTLANSTQLSLVNSFSFGFSTTTQSTGSRQSSYNGVRWITLATSNWSSLPVFSAGVQYWVGVNWRTAGQMVVGSWIAQQAKGLNAGTVYQGTFGVNQSASIQSRHGPMWGAVTFTATSAPASIGSANLVAEGNNSALMPYFQFRNGVFQ